mmetsp:Transcript_59091/g.117055  ORF Transcript_59091/g.117055 Transcript_59091/m.117055 type:complete len:84 (+) Transcript_59091:1404-1655(+)
MLALEPINSEIKARPRSASIISDQEFVLTPEDLQALEPEPVPEVNMDKALIDALALRINTSPSLLESDPDYPPPQKKKQKSFI